MKFVETFLQSHHLKHNPHKWFLALLLSPIHTAEMHYKKHYHLKFVHARKLFLFDMTLLLSILSICVAGLFWWTYDPTVTDLVYLSIRPNQERLISGQHISYNIQYENESDVTLTHPTITIDTPPGLTIETYEPQNILFDASSHTFTLSPISAHTSGTIQFSGIFFATPNVENTIHATLSYIQKGKEKREQKTSPAISIVRDSVIQLNIDSPTISLGHASLPLSLTLTNTGDIDLSDISLPLDTPAHSTLLTKAPDTGSIEHNSWNIPILTPKQSIKLKATLTITAPQHISNIPLSFTPRIALNNESIDQKTENLNITLLHPHINMSTTWDNSSAQPGSIQNLTLKITNPTSIALHDIDIDIPATNYSRKQTQHITSLDPHQTQTLIFPIQLFNHIPATDIDPTLILTPHLNAHIAHISDTYTLEHTTPAIPIGTQVFLNAELRYYTAEGDQLGRGPLPPIVGKETKYWAFIRISNTTSRIKNLYLSATLPDYVSWTGKTSVSHGQNVQYNNTTKQLTWSYPSLNPHTTAGIYVELSITPPAQMQNTTPPLLTHISLSTHDTYIDKPIYHNIQSIDISIPHDPIGNAKGIFVK